MVLSRTSTGRVILVPTQLRFDRWFLPLAVPLGLGPKNSELWVGAGSLHVKMGWAFAADIPLTSITKAEATNAGSTQPGCTLDSAAGWSTGHVRAWWH